MLVGLPKQAWPSAGSSIVHLPKATGGTKSLENSRVTTESITTFAAMCRAGSQGWGHSFRALRDVITARRTTQITFSSYLSHIFPSLKISDSLTGSGGQEVRSYSLFPNSERRSEEYLTTLLLTYEAQASTPALAGRSGIVIAQASGRINRGSRCGSRNGRSRKNEPGSGGQTHRAESSSH